MYCPITQNAFQLVDQIPLNPGLLNSFPWLSQIAANYEEYEFLQLAVTFKSTINPSIATNGQVGQVCIATNYNADQDGFGSKEEMISYSGGMSAKTSSSMIHGVECDPSKNSGSAGKYVRPGAVVGSLKEFDLGTTFISVLNAPTSYLGQALGELWISYTVQLRKPRITVGENYLVPTATLVAGPSTLPMVFGIVGDSTAKVATKSTLPVEFRLPTANTSPYTKVPLVGITAGFTIPQDALSEQVPTDPSSFLTTLQPYLICAIVFPTWYSGIVEIDCGVRYKVAGTSADDLNVIYPQCQGQIFRYQDIPWDDDHVQVSPNPLAMSSSWTHIMQGYGTMNNMHPYNNQASPPIPVYPSSVGISYNSHRTTLHVRVQPSLNGVENIIYLGTYTGSTVTGSIHAYCTVRGLNTYLSFDDSKQGSIAQSRAGALLPLTHLSTGAAATYP